MDPNRPSAALPLALLVALAAGACRDAGRPAPSPPSPGPAADLVLVPPLHDATVGEELVLRRGPTEWLYRVAEAHDRDVVVEVIVYEDGAPIGKPQRYRWERNGFGLPDDIVIASIAPARLDDADGSPRACWLLQGGGARGTFAFWIAEDVPVHGLLKMAKIEKGRPVEAGAIHRVR